MQTIKVFYLPYFTHYGAKAPRKRGFLTPTIEFTVGGDTGAIVPYYLPINQSTDILFKPKILVFLKLIFEFLEKYHLDTIVENKSSGGNTNITINNIKNNKDDNINTSIKIETKQILDKNKIFSASGLFTNSISTTRSINEEPIAFEELFLKLENYDFFINGDYLKTELSSVETFESTNLNTIPILPSINYLNFVELNNNSLMNEFDFTVIKRNGSTIDSPSEAVRIKLNSEMINNSQSNSKFINKKIVLNNSFNDYYFSDDKSLNHDTIKSFVFLSSDVNFNNFSSITPKMKFIIPMQLVNSNKKSMKTVSR